MPSDLDGRVLLEALDALIVTTDMRLRYAHPSDAGWLRVKLESARRQREELADRVR